MNRKTLKMMVGLLSLPGLVVMLAVIEHYRGEIGLWQWRRAAQARGEKLSLSELAPSFPPGQATVPADLVAARLFSPEDNGRTSHAGETLQIRLTMNRATPGRIPVAWEDRWEWKDLAESTNTWEELAAKIEDLRLFLQVIRSNLAGRQWLVGYDYTKGIGTRIPPIFDLERSAKVLAAAGLVDLHQHRLDEARENLMALPRLIELLSEGHYQIAQFGVAAVGRAAIPAVWQVLQAPGWTDPQLAQLQAAWQPRGYLGNLVSAMRMDRAMCDKSVFDGLRISLVAWIKLGRPSLSTRLSAPMEMFWWHAWLSQDQLFFDRTMQEPIDFTRTVLSAGSCRAAWLQRGLTPGASAVPDLRAPLFRVAANRTHWYDKMRYQYSGLCMGPMTDPINSAITLENFRGLLLAAVGLKRYELRHGRPAPSLAALVPEYLDTVPVDFMDGQPLRYRLQEDGTWRLYSIGWDGKDDGGDPTPASPGQKYETPSDGRDWVWPVPATPPDRSSPP